MQICLESLVPLCIKDKAPALKIGCFFLFLGVLADFLLVWQEKQKKTLKFKLYCCEYGYFFSKNRVFLRVFIDFCLFEKTVFGFTKQRR